MQKYAKKMFALICLFFISIMWYQPDNARIIVDNTGASPAESPVNSTGSALKNYPFNVACVPTTVARHGLDTDLRQKGLSQLSKNIHAQRMGHHASSYRCYFKVNPDHIGCFNPQMITKDYLDENGYDSNHAFPGGTPGQMCYFKKKFAPNYSNLITILRNKNGSMDFHNNIVTSAGAAEKKLAEPLTAQKATDS